MKVSTMDNFEADNVLSSSNQDRVTKVEELASRDWSRDNILQRFREVRNNRDTIESIVQDLMEDFESIPDEGELDDRWSSYLDQKDVDLDNKQPNDDIPAAYFLMTKRKVDALIRVSVWKSRLEELENFALQRFKTGFEELLEEYRLAKSYDTIQDALDEKSESWVRDLTEDKVQRMEAMISEFEKFEQARLEERKSDRELFRRLAEQADGVDEDKILGTIESAAENLENHLTSQGVLELDPESADELRSRKERDEAAETNAENEIDETDTDDSDGGRFEITLKDKTSVEERSDALTELAEELEPQVNGLSQDDIADHTDMTRQAIFGTNGVLQKCHNNDLFPGIDV